MAVLLPGDSELGARREGRGTPSDRIVVHRAPMRFWCVETLAEMMLSGHAFGIAVSETRNVITFGTPGEGEGVVSYEVKQPWKGRCLCVRVGNIPPGDTPKQ